MSIRLECFSYTIAFRNAGFDYMEIKMQSSDSSSQNGTSVERSVSDYRRKLRRSQLLTTAAKILTDEGPDAVRIPLVANLSGVTRPSVYKHFANRQELLLGVLQGLDEGLQQALQALISEKWEDPSVGLRMVIEAILDCAETWGAGAWNLLFSAGTDQDTRSLSREIIEKFMQPAQRRLGDVTGASPQRTTIYSEFLISIFHQGIGLRLQDRISRTEAVDSIHDSCVALIAALAGSNPGNLTQEDILSPGNPS
jgi:AcrR family transcriptional regulator